MADENTQTQTSQTDQTQGTEGQPQRPEHVPEKFWDAEAGAVRVDDVLGAYTKLESERGRQWDGLKTEVKASLEQELFGKRPGTPDEYKPVLPEDSGLVLLTEPPGEDFQPEEGKSYLVMKGDDPFWQVARDMAHRAGASNEEFSEAVAVFAQGLAERTPTAQELEDARTKEIEETLGEHGPARVDHVHKALTAVLGEDHADGINALPVASVAALEALLEKAGQPRFAAPANGESATAYTQADLDKVINDPNYWRDKSLQDKAADISKKLFPGKRPTASRGPGG